jgi:hypothetical protein
VLPALGLDEPAPTDALAPTDEDIAAAEDAEADEGEDPNSFGGDDLSSKVQSDDDTDDASGTTIPLPKNSHPSRPPESDSARKDMPKKSSLERGPQHVGARKNRKLDRNRPLTEQLSSPIYPVDHPEEPTKE